MGREDKKVWPKGRKLFEGRGAVESLNMGRGSPDSISPEEVLLRQVWEMDPCGVFLETPEGKILDCNPSACRIFGYCREELLRRQVYDLVPAHMVAFVRAVLEHGEVTGENPVDWEMLRSDGTVFSARIKTGFVTCKGKEFRIAYVRDVSYMRKVEEELRYRAYTDDLTGIWNRFYFHGRLEEEIERVRRYGSSLSLVMFDIDKFKQFNDRYGHVRGDKALKRVADVVRDSIRLSDCFCRWGGDEFLIFSPVPEEKCRAFAERLRREVKESTGLWGAKLTISLGVVEFRGEILKEALVDRVDQAMYKAKNAGGDRVCAWGSGQALRRLPEV